MTNYTRLAAKYVVVVKAYGAGRQKQSGRSSRIMDWNAEVHESQGNIEWSRVTLGATS